ncbi:MAG: hypothetical protein KGK11_09105 [Sphingomonadales bacterium]|nr:hypothetical protein [Sphingomonadales bacterium]
MRAWTVIGRLLLVGGLVWAVPQAALADDELRFDADVNANGGYSANPYSYTGSSLDSSYVEIDAKPRIRLISADSVLSLLGNVDYKHFFRLYPDNEDYNAGLDYTLKASDRLSAHAKLSYDNSIIGGIEALTPAADLSQQPQPTTGPDVALIGARIRRHSIDGGGDATYVLSQYSTLTASGFYDSVRFSGAYGFTDYDGYGGGLGYSRRLNEHLKLGLQASAARYVFMGALGDAKVYTLQATGSYTLNSRWTLTGAGGVSYSDRVVGGKTTDFTGNILLCRVTSRSNFCLNGSQAELPTGTIGIIATRTAGVSYSYQLTERSKLAFAGNYTNSSTPTFVQAYASGYLTTQVSFDRTLKERLHFITTARYRKITGGLANQPDDWGGTVGFDLKLGDSR